MTRVRLPDRRPSFTTQLVYEANIYSVTLGFERGAESKSARCSPTAPRSGPAWTACSTTCALRSAPAAARGRAGAARSSMGRLGDGKSPASIVGALADLIAREAQP